MPHDLKCPNCGSELMDIAGYDPCIPHKYACRNRKCPIQGWSGYWVHRFQKCVDKGRLAKENYSWLTC